MRSGLRAAGFRGQVEVFRWTSMLGPAPDHFLSGRNKRKGKGLAERIEERRGEHPGADLHLMGLSAGAAVIVFALEQLPANASVHNVVLFAPSISAEHDLSAAMAPGRSAMPEWIGNHKVLLGWLATSSVVTFVGTLIVIPMLVVRIPENYFVERRHHRLPWWERHPVLRLASVTIKNAAGWLFIAVGIAMLALPGQGIITIVVGLMLSDFPGKFGLERWLASRRLLIRAMNWTRSRAGRPPLQVPGPRPASTGH